jgi:hypothetical protein
LALLLGAACICATGILNAGSRLPGLCALHGAALLVCLPPARRRTSTPVCTCKCGAARRSASANRERPFSCGRFVATLRHAPHRSPVSARAVLYRYVACFRGTSACTRRVTLKGVLRVNPFPTLFRYTGIGWAHMKKRSLFVGYEVRESRLEIGPRAGWIPRLWRSVRPAGPDAAGTSRHRRRCAHRL